MKARRPNTFEITDKFELGSFASQLEAFIATEHHFVEGGLVISLNGAFGLGKTTFLEMWHDRIVNKRKEGQSLPVPIILNAWESDFCGDPLLAIISAVSGILGKSEAENASQCVDELREALNDVANFTIGLAGGVAKQLAGLDPVGAGKFAEEKKRGRKVGPKHEDLLAAYEGKLSALSHLKTVLTSVFGGDQPNAIVMVDELDRCRPNYAVEYLEMIKHVFDIHGLIFVLAVDKVQLRSSAKALFGADLNFNEYYRKFAHRNVELPAPSEGGLTRLVSHYSSTILEIEDSAFNRFSMLPVDGRQSNIVELAAGLKLTPRQIHEVFRVMGHAMAGSQKNRGNLLWGFGAGTILMSALLVAEPEMYRRIGTTTADILDFERILRLFSNSKHREWWAKVILMGYSPADQEVNETLFQEFIRIGAIPKEMTEKDNRQRLGQFATGWGSFGSVPGLQHVFNVIEGIKSFGG